MGIKVATNVQISLYTDEEEAQWGWKYETGITIDTGLVFTSREDAFEDALSKYPDAPIG